MLATYAVLPPLFSSAAAATKAVLEPVSATLATYLLTRLATDELRPTRYDVFLSE